MPTPRQPLLPVALAALPLLTAACQNNRAISPGREALPIFAEVQPGPPPSEGRSLLQGHDRSAWPRTVIAVPVNTLEHQPTYVLTHELMDTPRQRGLYPTASEALRVDPSLSGRLWGETARGWASALGGLVAAPFRMIFTERPWETQRGTRLDFERLRPQQQQQAESEGGESG